MIFFFSSNFPPHLPPSNYQKAQYLFFLEFWEGAQSLRKKNHKNLIKIILKKILRNFRLFFWFFHVFFFLFVFPSKYLCKNLKIERAKDWKSFYFKEKSKKLVRKNISKKQQRKNCNFLFGFGFRFIFVGNFLSEIWEILYQIYALTVIEIGI